MLEFLSFIIPLVIAVVITIIIVIRQLTTAKETKDKAILLHDFFPTYAYSVKDKIVPTYVLEQNERLLEFARDPDGFQSGEGYTMKVITCPKSVTDDHTYFLNIMEKTNAYLCKNQGNTDFNILKDICEREIQKLENEIESSIQLPLYWGLGGTFLGIICGTGFLAFSQMIDMTKDLSTANLLLTVAIAMVASALGLYLTVKNSTGVYKRASLKNEEDKQNYLSRLQYELLPSMNKGINDSLNKIGAIFQSFQGAMSSKFTTNIELLKDNLEGQAELMTAINNMDVIRTSSKIAEVWGKIQVVSSDISGFQEFQKSINATLEKTENILDKMNQSISKLNAFNSNVETLSEHVLATRKLEEQFKDSLELHFPTHDEPRRIWREHLDELNKDIKGAYTNLDAHFKETTILMKDFTQNNGDFFNGIKILQNMATTMEERNRSQTEAIEAVQTDMRQMAREMKVFAENTFTLNKEVVRLLERFNKSL